MAGMTIHVTAGVVELSGVAPTLATAHGADLTVDVAPSRRFYEITDTRVDGLAVAPTRAGRFDLADTRTVWQLGGTRPRNAVDVAGTRASTGIGDTRVARNRS